MKVVADTHALVWFLAADQRLSEGARRALEEAQGDPGGGVVVSLASRLDLHYLQRAGRFSPDQVQRIWSVTTDAGTNISAHTITAAVVDRFDAPEVAELRDPWDRLIVGTAMALNAPLVTRDRVITRLAATGVLAVIW